MSRIEAFMLCDDIRAAAQAPSDPAGQIYATGLRSLDDRIRKSVRFALERDVVEAAVMHCTSRPSNILKVLPLVRPPHRVSWIEWADADKTAAMDALSLPRREGKPAPQRVGALLTAMDAKATRFSAELAWRHADGIVNYAPLMLAFSVVDPWPQLAEPDRDVVPKIFAQDPTSVFHAYRNSATELEAVVDVSRHWIAAQAICAEEMRKQFGAMPGGQRALKAMDSAAYDDIGSEVMFLSAVLLLMATANGTRRQIEDRERLNLARIKRGQPPLLGFSTVRMRLSRSEQRDGTAVDPQAARARHICRGHAKLRVRGDGTQRLYWWSDHWRGRGPALRVAPSIKTVTR